MLGIFLDLETTGLDPSRHRVIELAFKIIDLRTNEELSTYSTIVNQPDQVWERRDPSSIAVNGFTKERLAAGKDEEVVALEVLQIFTEHRIRRGDAIFICQNPSFDRAYFAQIINPYEQEEHQWPYHWLDLASMFWAIEVETEVKKSGQLPKRLSLSKDAIAHHHGLPPEDKPHQAINGVNHLILCYSAVLGT